MATKRPSVKNPKTATQFVGQQPGNQHQVALNVAPFNDLIEAHGIRMVHSKPMPCPRRLSLTASDHDPSCTDCFNGFQYFGDQEFYGVMQGNGNDRQFQMNGSWDISNAQIIIPSRYKDGSQFDVQLYDQITVPDFSIRYYQLVEASQLGVDRLHFPAISVAKLVDANNVEYFPGKDFIVNQKGFIQWVSGGDRPGYNLDIDMGVIYSVNYYIRASFTIISLPHQLRVTQTINDAGESVQEYFPQLCVVRKDFIPHDPADSVDNTDRPSPRDGNA